MEDEEVRFIDIPASLRADEEAEAEAEEPLGLDSKIGDESNDLTAPLLAPARNLSQSFCYASKILGLALVWLAFFAIQLLRGNKTNEVKLLSGNPFLCDSEASCKYYV